MTERQMDILYYLHAQDDFVPVSDISVALQVSVKTIRNELLIIQEVIKKESLGTLEKKPRLGIKLVIEAEVWERYTRQLESKGLTAEEADEKSLLIYYLLTKGQINYTEIQKYLYMGRSAAERLIPEVEKWLKNRKITLEKGRGKGFWILCDEFSWRIAMWNLFLRIKKEKYTCRQKGEYLLIEDFLKGFDTNGINKAICFLERQYSFSFGYEAHIQMFFLLSLSIVRARNNKNVQLPDVSPIKVKERYTKHITETLIKELERNYSLSLQDTEKQFIEFAVGISDIQIFQDEKQMLQCEADDIELCYFSIRLISLLSDIVNVNLRQDLFFSKTLFLQLRSMIVRLQYNIKIVNPLLKQVKQKYPNVFAAVYGAGVYFEKELGLELNEHEMCSLALLLGGAIERSLSRVSACVICDYGIGMSQILREQLERNISDLCITEVLSIREIRKLKSVSCDLVITTMQLDTPYYGKEVVVVDCLMTQYDIRNIENRMKQVRRRKLKTKQPCNQLHIHKNLFCEEFVHLNLEINDKNELLHMLCKQLEDSGYVTAEFEKSVLEHEVTAPTALGKGVAIPHGNAKCVIRPAVMVATLKRPVKWQEDEDADVIFLLAFNLDDSMGMKEETVKFYSVFLDLWDEEAEVEAIRNMQDGHWLAVEMNRRIQAAVNSSREKGEEGK